MNQLFSLSGKVAVVTGALGLLGKEHCKALASAGAAVIVTDLDEKKCEEYSKEIYAIYGGSSMGISADITDEVSVIKMKDKIIKNYGKVDILINNAAINDAVENPKASVELSKFENYPVEIFRKSLDVNVIGTFICSKILGNEMAKNGKGCIVNIASTYGIVGPDQTIYQDQKGNQLFFKPPAYSASKGAIISFTKYLASYWGKNGVRVNSLSPGGVENLQDEYFIKNYSAKTVVGKMAQPNDYHGAIIFLSSDASNYMSGANLVVDGGWTAI